MIKLVRIQSNPRGPEQTFITNAETGETIPGVKLIDIHIGIMELPVATMEIYTEFDGVAKPIWKPVFARAGRCESCKWWERTADVDHLQTMAGEFDFAGGSRRNDSRPCALTGFHDYAYQHPESKALSVDAEHYEAQLYTAPDFGCVQWEPRQEDSGKDT